MMKSPEDEKLDAEIALKLSHDQDTKTTKGSGQFIADRGFTD